MERKTYKQKESLQGQYEIYTPTGHQQVIQAAAGFAQSITSIGEQLINFNETINSRKAVGDAIKKTNYANVDRLQSISVGLDLYDMALLDNKGYREKISNLTNIIDPTGKLNESVSSLSNKNQSEWARLFRERMVRNQEQRARDPGLYAMKVIGWTGTEITDERHSALYDAQHGQKNITLLTKAEADGYINQIMHNPDINTNIQTMEGILASPYADVILKQLSSMEKGLSVGYKLAAHIAPQYRTAYYRSMKLSDQDIADYTNKLSSDDIALSTIVPDMKVKISMDTSLNEFIDALTGEVAGKKLALAPGLVDTVTRLAFYQVINSGMDQDDAIEFAMKVVTEGFEIVKDDDVKIIAPKSEQHNVEEQTKKLKTIKNDPVRFDEWYSYYEPQNPDSSVPGLDDTSKKNMWVDYVRNNGFWVNADDTTEGYMYVVDYPERGVKEALVNENGQPIIMSHEDLDFFGESAKYKGRRYIGPEKFKSQETEAGKYKEKRRKLEKDLDAEEGLFIPKSHPLAPLLPEVKVKPKGSINPRGKK